MGEAKRRKRILGERYGTPETSPKKHLPENYLADWGARYLELFGTNSSKVHIASATIIQGNGNEANISFVVEPNYLGTLIVSTEFARSLQENPDQVIEVIPCPDCKYQDHWGGWVVPFKVVGTDISQSGYVRTVEDS